MQNLVGITSYNVLARGLEANQQQSKYLDWDVRQSKILAALTACANKKDILALQEVEPVFAEEVKTLLSCYGYITYYQAYGKHGALLAFPLSLYQAINCGQVVLGEVIAKKAITLDMSRVKQSWGKKKKNVLQLAMDRLNKLLWLHLSCKSTKRTFFVFNYHMPMFFYELPVMGAHASVLLETMDLLAKGKQYLLATDLNNQPNSPLYRYLRGGKIAKGLIPHLDWLMYNTDGLVGARVELGIKALTTCCADRKGKEFQGCLDYIFVSEGWLANKFEQKMTLELLPSQEEGSDHIPVRAILI